MIKAVVLDLDGTLLDHDNKISDLNREILKKLDKKGVKIFLATGRSYKAMKPYYDELNLTTPAICYNGAKIVYPDDTQVEYPLTEKIVKILINIARKNRVHLNLYQDEVWISENITNEESIIYEKISELKPVQKNFDLLESYNSTKVLYIANNPVLINIKNQIKKQLGDSVYTIFSRIFFLEILDANINKGQAMTKIMNDFKIPLSQVIAFGDGLNDLEMLECAGLGIAMENAFEDLKKISNDITSSNNKSGVGEYLQKYI